MHAAIATAKILFFIKFPPLNLRIPVRPVFNDVIIIVLDYLRRRLTLRCHLGNLCILPEIRDARRHQRGTAFAIKYVVVHTERQNALRKLGKLRRISFRVIYFESTRGVGLFEEIEKSFFAENERNEFLRRALVFGGFGYNEPFVDVSVNVLFVRTARYGRGAINAISKPSGTTSCMPVSSQDALGVINALPFAKSICESVRFAPSELPLFLGASLPPISDKSASTAFLSRWFYIRTGLPFS